jgi:hypothetical protein
LTIDVKACLLAMQLIPVGASLLAMQLLTLTDPSLAGKLLQKSIACRQAPT